jgi:hypothetical protein
VQLNARISNGCLCFLVDFVPQLVKLLALLPKPGLGLLLTLRTVRHPLHSHLNINSGN